jgi:hypothetical protein
VTLGRKEAAGWERRLGAQKLDHRSGNRKREQATEWTRL